MSCPVEIYLLTSPSGKCYVGQTRHGVATRWKEHIKNARSGKQTVLAKAIRKYGPEAFTVKVLEICDSSESNLRETFFIEQLTTFFPNGYNLIMFGQVCKKVVTEETRKNMSEAQLFRYATRESREVVSRAALERDRLTHYQNRISPNKGKFLKKIKEPRAGTKARVVYDVLQEGQEFVSARVSLSSQDNKVLSGLIDWKNIVFEQGEIT